MKIKSKLILSLFSFMIFIIIKIFEMTITIKIINKKNYTKRKSKNFIYVFWHQDILAATFVLSKTKNVHALVSKSKDGDYLSNILKKYGYKLIRGSSNDGGAKSLIESIEKAKTGNSLAISVDGPTGPIFKCKPGAVKIFQKSNIKIIPVGVSKYSRVWIFEKAWDKFRLPKPFSKIVFKFGNPLKIDAKMDLGEALRIVNNSINNVKKL